MKIFVLHSQKDELQMDADQFAFSALKPMHNLASPPGIKPFSPF